MLSHKFSYMCLRLAQNHISLIFVIDILVCAKYRLWRIWFRMVKYGLKVRGPPCKILPSCYVYVVQGSLVPWGLCQEYDELFIFLYPNQNKHLTFFIPNQYKIYSQGNSEVCVNRAMFIACLWLWGCRGCVCIWCCVKCQGWVLIAGFLFSLLLFSSINCQACAGAFIHEHTLGLVYSLPLSLGVSETLKNGVLWGCIWRQEGSESCLNQMFA